MASKKKAEDVEAPAPADDMAWDNEWDDNDSAAGPNGSGERQHILRRSGDADRETAFDPDEDDIENEIRTNLNSKITSSLHAYKIAGVALIVALISFTINTVAARISTCRD
jgi:hypothetical protein